MPGPSDRPENKRFGREVSRPRTGSFQQGERPRSDRPQREDNFGRGERPARDDRPRSASFGERNGAPRADRPFQDRPRQDRPAPYGSDRPRQDRPAYGSDRPRQDRPAFGSDKPRFDQSRSASFSERGAAPRGERSYQDRPRQDRSYRAPAAPVVKDEDYNEPQKAVGGIAEVEALLKSRPGIVHRVLFQKDSGDKRLYALQKLVKHLHIHHQQLEVAQLEEQVQGHQGVVALCHEKEVNSWESVRQDLFAALESNTPKTVAVIVNIEDPRNLGACLRSALALGVDAVLIPSKGMCGLTPLTARASAGALSQLTLCRPDNLEAALGELVAAGYDLVGLDSDTPLSLHDTPFKAHTVIAVGGEDRDLPPFIRKQCTKVLRIPMVEEAHSYNASVALTLALYERARSTAFQGMLVSPEQYAAKQEAKRAEWAATAKK